MVTSISPTFCVPPLFMPEILETTLGLEPHTCFINADNEGFEFLAKFHGVGNVIEVAVRDQHCVDAIDFFSASGVMGFD